MSYAVDHALIDVVLSSKQSQHPWGGIIWNIEKVVFHDDRFATESEEQSDGCLYLSKLELELHQLHCEAYYQNLISAQPKLYLICHSTPGEELSPHILTVDYDEANSYTESEQTVLMAPLPETLCLWLERFVVNHYVPEKRTKRRRKKWHDDGKPA